VKKGDSFVEILIKNGRIVDGSGNPWYFGSVGVDKGKIVRVGSVIADSRTEIDASGLMICPGFIDSHTHSDFVFIEDPFSSFKVLQGVTTEIIGNCGFSAAPVTRAKQFLKIYHDYISQITSLDPSHMNWQGMGGFLARLKRNGIANNIVALVGHGNLRIAAMGMDNRSPTENEMAIMKRLLEEGMKSGAKGMSTGLMYPPGFYCDTSEIIELGRVVAEYGGIVTSHIRSYEKDLEASIEELIRVGHEASAPIHVSHITAAQEPNWGKLGRVLEKVDEARENGVDITMDRYPYTAANTTLRSILPPEMQQGGVDALLVRLKDPEIKRSCAEKMGNEYNWNTMSVNYCQVHQDLNGKTVAEIAKIWDKGIHETIFDLLLDENGQPRIIFFIHSEEDMKTAFKHPTVMVGSDSTSGGPDSHPRTYGTFPRILREIVIKQKLLALEEAVKKMTSFPAQRFGLQDRGLIRQGMTADITIIDLNKIRDRSTYSNPCLEPEGVDYVIVNGELVVDRGIFLKKSAGKVLLTKRDRLWK
jgi:N-acyl-D-amino-acid deacylase